MIIKNIFKCLVFIIFVLNKTTYAQTKIDDVISIKFPGKVELFEQKEKDTYVRGYNFNSKKESFIFVRSVPVKGDGSELKVPSKSFNKLISKYKYTSKLLIEGFEKKTFIFSDSLLVSYEGFKAYKLIFKDKAKDKKMVESVMIDLNGVLYYGIYVMLTEFNEGRKNDFFNSLKINNPKNQKQIVKPSFLELFFNKN
jgi:hypothetical protein